MDLRFLQELDNFMSYNFVVNTKSNSQSKLVENFKYYSSGFLVLKIEPLYFANIFCCTCPTEPIFGEHSDDEIWHNFGIQVMS